MTPFIQSVIEDKIDLIEQQDWNRFFIAWYTDYSALSRSTDIEHLRELFEILSEAGINAEEESYQIRKDIVQFSMEVIIRDLFDNDSQLEKISMVRVINELQSRLYLSLTEILPLYKEAVDATGYKLAEDSLTIVRR